MDPWMYAHDKNQLASPEAHSAAATQTVRDAQRLLGHYPLASATPTHPVARGLAYTPMPSAPPTYMHPDYYARQQQSMPLPQPVSQQGQYSYGEYNNEIRHLYTGHPSTQDGGYWIQARDDAVRYMNPNQNNAAYINQVLPSHLWQSPSASSNVFTQSTFQSLGPSSVYPTPPPPCTDRISSYSSLANALVQPPPKPRKKVYQPEQSAAFFDNFLAQETQRLDVRDVNVQPQQSMQPQQSHVVIPKATSIPQEVPMSFTAQLIPQQTLPSSNALPSALPIASVQYKQNTLPPPAALNIPNDVSTPRKRKTEEQLHSPSLKRLALTPTRSVADPSTPSHFRPWTPTRRSGDVSTPTKVVPPRQNGNAVKPEVALSKAPGSGRLRQVCVEVPTLKSLHRQPSEYKFRQETPMDMSDDEMGAPSSPTKSSPLKTGGRDERGPLEKLVALFEDIFEAEDSLDPESSISDLPREFFSSHTTEVSAPLLSVGPLRKMSKQIEQVSRPPKRLRSGAGTSPRKSGSGRVAEIDTVILTRVMRILERTLRAAEALDPFKIGNGLLQKTAPRSRSVTASPSKRRGKKKAKGDDEMSEAGQNNGEADSQSLEALAEDVEGMSDRLNLASESILAAEAYLTLLTSDRLPKQLYSEDLITSCLNIIKNHLDRIIYPFVESSTESSNALLNHVTKDNSSLAKTHRSQITDLSILIFATLPKINKMVHTDVMTMSDGIVIQTVYIAIGPFFLAEVEPERGSKGKKESLVQSTIGATALRGLRLDSISLLRSIFANYKEQRSWIVEEILSSLVKLSDQKQKTGHFKLRDGHSIRTISALLLQLIQTAAHDVRTESERVQRVRQQQATLSRGDSSVSIGVGQKDAFLDELDFEELRIYGGGLESAGKVAKTIVGFLTSRFGKTKATKNSNEAEYRAIFDHLVSDVMVVLFWPEWPAASLLLNIICKYMLSSLDDIKSSTDGNNAAKSSALDHLGSVAAKLKASQMRQTQNERRLLPLDEIAERLDEQALETLIAAHREVLTHLAHQASSDPACESARELCAAAVAQELSVVLMRLNDSLKSQSQEDATKSKTNAKTFRLKLKQALGDVWKGSTDIFDISSQDDMTQVDATAEALGTVQGLRSAFNPILNVILTALDASAIFMRSKALKSLGQIITSDPQLLSLASVRHAIEGHLLDASASVRDAAVELIGKHMIDTPSVAAEYYRKIADRIQDTGLAVRKRVVKLLRSFYDMTSEHDKRVDICIRLVQRVTDEDDGVKELAVKSIEELWFHSASLPNPSKSRVFSSDGDAGNRHDISSKIAVIMAVCAAFKDRQTSLDDVMYKIMSDREAGSDSPLLLGRYREMCEALIDGLVDDSDIPGFTVNNCVRTILLFATAYPAVLSDANATTLLPYVKHASTVDERQTSDYLLKIFRITIPHMPKAAAKFGSELQAILQPLITKPTGSLLSLQETVACMCAVVKSLTHEYIRLVKLLVSCNARLRSIAEKSGNTLSANDASAAPILTCITSLLVEHCDFDQLREDQASLGPELDRVTPHCVIDHVYDLLLDLYDKYDDSNLKARVLLCLGFLFRAKPTLMTLDSSAAVMDAIFASPDENDHGRLLKIFQDFLLSQVAKHNETIKGTQGKGKGKAVNMDELIGNTDGFADSGVSLAIVQRYIKPILAAVLSQTQAIQASAMDILSFTVRQGLSHPMQCFPTIVALETCPSAYLSTRASSLHAILHSKHASVLNARHIQSMRGSFDYQQRLNGANVKGYRLPGPTALFHAWYSLVREKRPARQDFLKSTMKAFDIDADFKCTRDDAEFVRYMAENVSALDYKTQEEVLTVLRHLIKVLSTIGSQLVEAVSPSNLLSQLHGGEAMDRPPDMPLGPDQQLTDSHFSLMYSTVVCGMIMLLKGHLKEAFGLTEDKCLKFQPGKKSAIGDKPAVRRHDRPLTWERLPFATQSILTPSDIEVQKKTFLEIWNEDGVAAEPEEDMEGSTSS